MKIIDLIMLSHVERTKNTNSNDVFGTVFPKECGMRKSGMTIWKSMVEEKWYKNIIQKHTEKKQH